MSLTKVTYAMIDGAPANVNDFGAVGDGVTDDTAAIQAALDTGRTVIFPSDSYLISDSLQILGQKIIGLGSTARAGSDDTFSMTTINVSGNVPAFIYTPTTNVTFEIEGLRIVYNNGVMPTTATGHSNQIGFYFNNPTFPSPPNGAQFSKISNCMVFGAWQAYYQDGGAYLTRIERFWSWNCYKGFYSKGGTTLEFDTCYVLQGCSAWNIQNTVGLTITNSGFDQCSVTADSPSNAICLFSAIDNFTFNEFQAESNFVEADFGAMILIYSSAGTFNGFNTWGNTLKNLTSGKDVYLVLLQQSWVSFDGCNPVRGAGALYYTGASGFPATIAATSYSFVTATASLIRPSAGGTPTANYALSNDNTSLAVYNASSITGTTTAFNNTWKQSANWTPVLNGFTVTGTPIITAKYVKTAAQSGGVATVEIQIDPNGGTVASAAGTSNITGLPFTPAMQVPFVVSNNFAALTPGSLSVYGEFYTPTITTTSQKINITATFTL